MQKQGTLIIAEAGVNHNGSLKLAQELIDAAADAGADVVKFQTFQAEKIASSCAPKADYQIDQEKQSESQLSMLKRLELSQADHFELIEHCKRRQIQFLSTPFDRESADFLINTLSLSQIKIPSGEITTAPLLLQIASSGKPVILSTGMATLADIEVALSILAFGYLQLSEKPSAEALLRAYISEVGQQFLKSKVTLLHCTSEYPTSPETINLRAMDTLNAAFGLPVGYSDHSMGITIPIAAVARGATIIEKHFTLDRQLPGPDHKASLEPPELKAMVQAIRDTEKALGSARKLPTLEELKTRVVARKSLVALSDIEKGKKFSIENLGVKRPGNGISALQYWDFLEYCSVKTHKAGDLIVK